MRKCFHMKNPYDDYGRKSAFEDGYELGRDEAIDEVCARIGLCSYINPDAQRMLRTYLQRMKDEE